MENKELKDRFFIENLTLIFKLFISSFGVGILLFSSLKFEFFGVKISYFISGQATIYLSILLLYLYSKSVSKLEKKYENL